MMERYRKYDPADGGEASFRGGNRLHRKKICMKNLKLPLPVCVKSFTTRQRCITLRTEHL